MFCMRNDSLVPCYILDAWVCTCNHTHFTKQGLVIINLFFYIIDGPVLKSAPIYNHIIYIIERVEKGAFIEVYCNILLKIILPVRKHTNELGSERWQSK